MPPASLQNDTGTWRVDLEATKRIWILILISLGEPTSPCSTLPTFTSMLPLLLREGKHCRHCFTYLYHSTVPFTPALSMRRLILYSYCTWPIIYAAYVPRRRAKCRHYFARKSRCWWWHERIFYALRKMLKRSTQLAKVTTASQAPVNSWAIAWITY